MRKEQVRKNPRDALMTPKQDDNTPKSLELSEGQLEVHFRRLNLAHTRRIYKEVADRAEKESWSYRDFLALLLAEEVARRKQTRLQRCTRSAHFPFFKTIDEFDFTLQSTLRESVIGSYLGLDFVTEGRSLILHGRTGRGKTHLAVAIGYRAIQNGFETLFTTAAELIEDLSNASKRGHLQESLATYTHPHVLVIDEVGYLTYGPDAANVLFHVVNDRHLKKRPMIFTTNKPLTEWGKVLHDEDMAAAILDRVLERGRFIHLDGPSGRTRHLNLQEVLPAGADRARISGIDVPEFPEPTFGNDPRGEEVRYSPAECIGTRVIPIIGNPKAKHISTSFAERQNLTMRMQMRRFTRLTNAFSKKVDNLRHAVALHFMHYNFCRVHQTLRVTPAMEAGIADHIWSLEEVVSLLDRSAKIAA
jgi:DNA replication protein DnaC